MSPVTIPVRALFYVCELGLQASTTRPSTNSTVACKAGLLSTRQKLRGEILP
jgi:hypothetical protein